MCNLCNQKKPQISIVAHKAKRSFHHFQKKYKNIHVVVQHHVIPFYNPYNKIYRECNPTEPTIWEVRICQNHDVKAVYMLKESIDDIQKIAMWISSI